MTNNTVELSNFLGNLLQECHSDAMRDFLAQTLRSVMDAEVFALCGAGYGERSGERENSRNGYRPRAFETRALAPSTSRSRSCARGATSPRS